LVQVDYFLLTKIEHVTRSNRKYRLFFQLRKW